MNIYDEADWTKMDIEDLKAAIESGARSKKRPIYYAAPMASKRWPANGRSWVSSRSFNHERPSGPATDPGCDQAQRVLGGYIEPEPRDPEGTMAQLVDALARPGLVAAVQRVRAGYGVRVVK